MKPSAIAVMLVVGVLVIGGAFALGFQVGSSKTEMAKREMIVSTQYVKVSRILTVVTSIGMIYSLYAQGYKIWKRKSAVDIHAAMAIVPLVSEIAWLNYGFAIMEWPILVICGVNLGACIMITTGYLKYRKGTPNLDVVERGLGI